MNQKKFQKSRDWQWAILAICALLFRLFTPPQYIERFYSRGLFVGVRWAFDHTLAYLPFPLLLFFYGVLGIIVFKFFRFLWTKNIPLKTRFTEGGRRLLNFAGFMFFGFLILWGFNYGRPHFSQQIGLKEEKLDTTALRIELEIATSEALTARQLVTTLFDTTVFYADNNPLTANLESNIRTTVSNFLQKKGFPNGGNLRGRQVRPQGFLSTFGISGIYMPYIGEASIESALHPLEKPFSMAHEMAHGYGWTEEATANFIAYLSCRESPDAFISYSAFLEYFRYVASHYRRANPKAYTAFRATLPTGFIKDLEAIKRRQDRYPSWLDSAWLNDFYLKSQGVTEGVGSYSKMVVWVYSWRKNEVK